jgi:hypothetical protein
MATRFIKATQHCGEPLNETADARASAAADSGCADDAQPMADAASGNKTGMLILHPGLGCSSVYTRGCPEWGTPVRNHLASLAVGQATAAPAVPTRRTRRDSTVRANPITTAVDCRRRSRAGGCQAGPEGHEGRLARVCGSESADCFSSRPRAGSPESCEDSGKRQLHGHFEAMRSRVSAGGSCSPLVRVTCTRARQIHRQP